MQFKVELEKKKRGFKKFKIVNMTAENTRIPKCIDGEGIPGRHPQASERHIWRHRFPDYSDTFPFESEFNDGVYYQQGSLLETDLGQRKPTSMRRTRRERTWRKWRRSKRKASVSLPDTEQDETLNVINLSSKTISTPCKLALSKGFSSPHPLQIETQP